MNKLGEQLDGQQKAPTSRFRSHKRERRWMDIVALVCRCHMRHKHIQVWLKLTMQLGTTAKREVLLQTHSESRLSGHIQCRVVYIKRPIPSLLPR